mgnify:CR=1 FL=1
MHLWYFPLILLSLSVRVILRVLFVLSLQNSLNWLSFQLLSSKWCSSINMCLSYIAGFIFYILTVSIPQKEREEKFINKVEYHKENIKKVYSSPKTAKRTRFIDHVETDATHFFRSTDDIEKEILKHLNLAAGTKVKITIHIEASNHEGFSQDTERTLKENGRTLGFGNVKFD